MNGKFKARPSVNLGDASGCGSCNARLKEKNKNPYEIVARDETELFPLSTCMQANTNIPPKKKKKKIQGNAKLACPKLKVLVKNQRLQRWKLLHLVGCFGKLNPGIISHIKNKIKKERLQIHHPLY